MKRETYVHHEDATRFANQFTDGSVDLLAFDPPFYGIVDDGWDHQWKSVEDFVSWFATFLVAWRPKLAAHGSVVFFGGLGKHAERAFYKVQIAIEELFPASINLTYRNTITWKKRRAYGKSHDYLFTREEIVWYSVSDQRTNVRFNIPLTEEKRGYAGFNPKYPAKSEFKRVSNVWVDIPELMRPERSCQKPVALMERVINTHSNVGDLVVDPFSGWGTTGVAAVKNGRDFQGCEGIKADAEAANLRVMHEAGVFWNKRLAGELFESQHAINVPQELNPQERAATMLRPGEPHIPGVTCEESNDDSAGDPRDCW